MRPPGTGTVFVGILLAACAGTPAPATLDSKNEVCAFCRMAVSDRRFAAQLVAPAEEPRFFDDVGCLAGHLRENRPRPRAIAYVADHGTKEWIPAARAVYTRVSGLETPMASHVIAHGDAASREADPSAKGGSPLSVRDVFGPAGPPDGTR